MGFKQLDNLKLKTICHQNRAESKCRASGTTRTRRKRCRERAKQEKKYEWGEFLRKERETTRALKEYGKGPHCNLGGGGREVDESDMGGSVVVIGITLYALAGLLRLDGRARNQTEFSRGTILLLLYNGST